MDNFTITKKLIGREDIYFSKGSTPLTQVEGGRTYTINPVNIDIFPINADSNSPTKQYCLYNGTVYTNVVFGTSSGNINTFKEFKEYILDTIDNICRNFLSTGESPSDFLTKLRNLSRIASVNGVLLSPSDKAKLDGITDIGSGRMITVEERNLISTSRLGDFASIYYLAEQTNTTRNSNNPTDRTLLYRSIVNGYFNKSEINSLLGNIFDRSDPKPILLSSYVPTANGDIATKSYVDSQAISPTTLGNYLSKTNTTPFTPTQDYHPATKKYNDDRAISDLTDEITSTNISNGSLTSLSAEGSSSDIRAVFDLPNENAQGTYLFNMKLFVPNANAISFPRLLPNSGNFQTLMLVALGNSSSNNNLYTGRRRQAGYDLEYSSSGSSPVISAGTGTFLPFVVLRTNSGSSNIEYTPSNNAIGNRTLDIDIEGKVHISPSGIITIEATSFINTGGSIGRNAKITNRFSLSANANTGVNETPKKLCFAFPTLSAVGSNQPLINLSGKLHKLN